MQLGQALESAGKSNESGVKEPQEACALGSKLAQNRTILLVRSGRGLSVLAQKTRQEQDVGTRMFWWRRGESNPRPKVFHQI